MDAAIRVVVFQEGDGWIAQGLEHDICAQGKSFDEAAKRFERTVRAEMRDGGGKLGHIEPAPGHYFSRWDQRSKFVPAEPSAYRGLEMALVA